MMMLVIMWETSSSVASNSHSVVTWALKEMSTPSLRALYLFKAKIHYARCILLELSTNISSQPAGGWGDTQSKRNGANDFFLTRIIYRQSIVKQHLQKEEIKWNCRGLRRGRWSWISTGFHSKGTMNSIVWLYPIQWEFRERERQGTENVPETIVFIDHQRSMLNNVS